MESVALAQEDKVHRVERESAADIEQIKQRLDMLDQRLDNIDSLVTAVAERVTSQPVTLYVTCPNCGKNVEIAILGIQKPTK